MKQFYSAILTISILTKLAFCDNENDSKLFSFVDFYPGDDPEEQSVLTNLIKANLFNGNSWDDHRDSIKSKLQLDIKYT